MARKKREEECPSIPGWLVSFGDLMSLLLTFFILLYAMSTVDVTKALKFLSYFQGEPKFKPLRVSVLPPIVPFATDVAKKIRKRIERLLPPHAFQISVTTKYVMLRIFNDILFYDGSSVLTPKAKESLKDLAKTLAKIEEEAHFFIRVQGHVKKGTPHPWVLSIKRAEAVALFLMSEGIDPSLFFITGYGDTRPLYTWNNPLLIRRNDRVEIYIEIKKIKKFYQKSEGGKGEREGQ
ncbi:MAG: flagellar motor protein MotB [Epsilonproteobacteria bacterium]|nr:flagellar motor protein MotB [Campylobacterota bacterium]NPA56503.1 flagellar motor protein MotB [Campylobacterota bacterium]